ncbi:hypothetical protein [Microbulbifer thermotolerans]|uniref:Shikimate kinase n=1 Tax=Microbulbifer thermotolerans TaxID=252514 RepID=A0AB35HVA5_MICTH|nr:hypothetical protein [Microbulbifer thermotolerans]MCX2800692.1 hypothetical protein [Microbulbifer thermotolerans]MCX2830047.1 hypothetical protein [Microbulbifer thermotolerans]MCX2841516.1 hypothetical protein [Microbulbifer thermotolerans]
MKQRSMPMSELAAGRLPDNRYLLFRVFKYTVYLLLTYNVYAFFVENHAAAGAVFSDGLQWGRVIEAYNDSIDTLAWVLLLLVFELETFVLDDRLIRGWVKWSLNAVSTVCYLFITYSCYGYIAEMVHLTDLSPVVETACELAAQGGWQLVVGQDDYVPLAAGNCASLGGIPLLRLADAAVLGSAATWSAIKWLAWTDVINASAWLLVVAILAFEVWLQLRQKLSERVMRWSQIVKGSLYFTLFLCAIYWGVSGSFLDFWDAFLWLVAFFFIEMNLFQWQAETRGE